MKHALIAILLTLCASAQAGTIGIHTLSAHIPQENQVNENWGAYYRFDTGTELGAYRNSVGRTAAYILQQFKLAEGSAGRVDFQIGLASGYKKECHTEVTYPTQAHRVETEYCKGFSRGALTPLAGLAWTAPIEILGATPRIQFAPAIKGHASVVHLSVEYRFK